MIADELRVFERKKKQKITDTQSKNSEAVSNQLVVIRGNTNEMRNCLQ